eukprot:c35109_g1_i1.p1 GENE.c35109_g1_i1~~c35109_g1_i1.p1  ORF type:complete len:183 (-),score=15.44 c35109_g1_i1:30-578(-)
MGYSTALIVYITMAILLVGSANAIKESFRGVLQEKFMNAARGVTNCEQNCNEILEGTATAGEVACLRGCNYCLEGKKFAVPDNTCFTYCKTQDWSAEGICKDTIEPDKACMLGCMISLCQGEDLCVGCDVAGGAKCCWQQKFTYKGKKYPGCESPTKTFPASSACSKCSPNCNLYPTEEQCN